MEARGSLLLNFLPLVEAHIVSGHRTLILETSLFPCAELVDPRTKLNLYDCFVLKKIHSARKIKPLPHVIILCMYRSLMYRSLMYRTLTYSTRTIAY